MGVAAGGANAVWSRRVWDGRGDNVHLVGRAAARASAGFVLREDVALAGFAEHVAEAAGVALGGGCKRSFRFEKMKYNEDVIKPLLCSNTLANSSTSFLIDTKSHS